MLYRSILEASPKLAFQRVNRACNYSYFPVILPSEQAVLHVEKRLQAQGIYPRRYFYPSVNTYTAIVPYQPMPVSEDIARRILCLPLYYSLPETELKKIACLTLSAIV
jgi:dTDP-4-amino-4,6-dideoxygalactose transaminase